MFAISIVGVGYTNARTLRGHINTVQLTHYLGIFIIKNMYSGMFVEIFACAYTESDTIFGQVSTVHWIR